MNVQALASEIRRLNPDISEEEAMQMARAQAGQQQGPAESRTDGAPAVDLTPDPGLDYPEQRYRFNEVSQQYENIEETNAARAADEQREIKRSGKFGHPFGKPDEPFMSQDEADAYSARPEGGPSQQDLDMLNSGPYNRDGTGWVMVYGEDGVARPMRRAPAPEVEVRASDESGDGGGAYVGGSPITQSPAYRQPDYSTPGQSTAAYRYVQDINRGGLSVDSPMPDYMEGYDWGGVNQGWANEATGNQRVGEGVNNRDVSGAMPQRLEGSKPEYDRVPTLKEGPNGPVWVYDYDPKTKSTRDENAKATRNELQLRRMAKSAGISMAEAREMRDESGSVDGIRDLIFDRRNSEERDRKQAVRTRNMLAGNDPRQNLANAYNTLSPEDQRSAMLGMMFPQGATPLDVEQASAAAVRETPLELMMRQRELDLMERQARQAEDAANPSAAGARHLSEGQYDTPEAMQELDRLTLQFDTTYGGFSVENERRLAAALQAPPYNIPQAEAERIAYEQAESRRWGSGSPPGEQPPPAPASAGPAAWGGAAG